MIFCGVDYGTAVDFTKYGAFAKGQASYFDGRLDVGMGLRALTAFHRIRFRHLVAKGSLSYQLTPDDQWRFNASVGRYYKIPTYTMLGFQGFNGVTKSAVCAATIMLLDLNTVLAQRPINR